MKYLLCCFAFILSAIVYPLENPVFLVTIIILFIFLFGLFFFKKIKINVKNFYLSIFFSLFIFCYFQIVKRQNKIPNISINKNNVLKLKIVAINGFGKKYFECTGKLLSVSDITNTNFKEAENSIFQKSIAKQNIFVLIKSRLMITNLKIGDVVKVSNKKIYLTKNLPSTDYASYLLRKRIIASIYLIPSDLIKVTEINSLSANFKNLQIKIRKKIKQKTFSLIKYPASSLTYAMVSGDKKYIPNEILEDFRESGTYHMLAVSGLHAGIVALFFFSFFRLFFLRRETIFILLLFVIFPIYLFIVDSPISIIRTYMMGLFGFILKKINRNLEYHKIWAIIFVAVLLISPTEINNISFQLSFSAVFGIFLALEIIKNFKIKNSILQYTFISLAAQSFTAPILIYYFGYLNFFTFFYNVAISFILFLSLLLSLVFLLNPIYFINIFLSDSISLLNHGIFYILKKTSYKVEWFTIDKKKDFIFAIFIVTVILSISFGLKYFSFIRSKKSKNFF